MKKWLLHTILAVIAGGMILGLTPVFCYADDTIMQGVYADNIPLGGMTEGEAYEAIQVYVNELKSRSITLYTVNDNEVTVTPEDMGLSWVNTDLVSEAMAIGKSGNVVSRYKAKKDVNYTNKIFDIEFSVDEDMVRSILEGECSAYNVNAKNGSMTRQDGSFSFVEGTAGLALDVDASLSSLTDFMLHSWSGQNTAYQLTVSIDSPAGSSADMELVKDVLGTYHTNFKTSTAARCSNVSNGASHLNGTVVYPGEEFSFTECVSPFTEANGYKLAASYASGKVVDSVGGGICQVSSTLYNAVLLSELEVTQRRNHGMIVTYVKPAMDATIAESSGTDFKFRNNTDAPIYIDAYTTDDKDLYITIYGHETRPADRELKYESEVISTTEPGPDVILEDASKPIGYISTQAAHTGYKANCWKIVTENGETTKELVNTSTYNMAPRYITVGTATDDANALTVLRAAIATGDTSYVKSTAASLKSTADSGATVDPNAAAMAEYEAALATMDLSAGDTSTVSEGGESSESSESSEAQ